MKRAGWMVVVLAVVGSVWAGALAEERVATRRKQAEAGAVNKAPAAAQKPVADVAIAPDGKVPGFVNKAVAWLVTAQQSNGGWGAGSHANQQLRDPHGVQTDPATTAFVGLALLRSGHTPLSGDHRAAVQRATEYLVKTVRESSENGPKITTLTGTQPQSKLGPLVDTSMASLFLSRVLNTLPEDHPMRGGVDAALEKCLRKIEQSQQDDGRWAGGGGWAPVLQSSLNCSALELAQVAGKEVNLIVLNRARKAQTDNVVVANGRATARVEDAAGVELYAFAGAQRANAIDAKRAKTLVEEAKTAGRLAPAAPVSQETLESLGVDRTAARSLAKAVVQDEVQIARLDDEQLLAGFGNNGGEEYLSYMMTSESLVISGGEAWQKWNTKIHNRLAKIQSSNGSWTGHHCITSPVFCTAAVTLCLTAERDAELLRKIAPTVETIKKN